jgi:diguanylate cyclase (GGDEF)-like protein
MDSNVGLAIQCVGVLLITLLSMFMQSSIKSNALRYWTAAWASLSLSLISLFAAFRLASTQTIFYSCYFLGEYLFGLWFIAGCRAHVTGATLTKNHRYFLVPAVVVSLVLPYVSRDFNDLFMIHAAILAVLFMISFFSLRIGHGEVAGPGIRVMSAALLLMTFDFLHYVPAFAARKGLFGVTVPSSYFRYTSLFDLLLELLLGFGTVMVLMEGVRREVELANRKLTEARDQLELLVQMDPLTEALNRHAFHSLLRRPESGTDNTATSGSVAVLDIDNLKPINDTLGHTVGDKAIRAVARAMRSLVRADDMLFRWGGDEFLVLMFKLPQPEASRRIAKLNKILEENCERWIGESVRVTVSFGVAGFTSLTDLGQAIEQADKAMYAQRNQVRGAKTVKELGEAVF